ncbi:MAG: hypothetical protein JWQ35_1399 [Bacteriovoracaceae bacterium]|nr:hypothetical protein [Bacteriovoracaceae bacterium]
MNHPSRNEMGAVVEQDENSTHRLRDDNTLESEKKIHLLLVEDSPADAKLFEIVLGGANDAGRYWLVHVKRLAKALKFVKRERFDAIILDLNLPDSHGLESIEQIRAEAGPVPIIVLTGLEDDAVGLEAVKRGAQDYMVKGSVDGNALSESIQYAIARHKIVSDIAKERDQQAYFAGHDLLTGLPNSKLLRYQLEHTIAQAARTSKTFGLLFIDIDNFKSVNDSFGHTAADDLLKAFAKRLSGDLRGGDIAARVGGDEFVVVLDDIKRVQDAAIAAQRLLESVSCNYKIHGQYISPTFSIGISVYPKDDVTPEGLISAADFAMLQAKQMGKNRYCYFSANMNVKAQETKELEAQLKYALENHQLEVHYQPEFDMRSGNICGVQGLVRWNHPSLGIVPARHFIPFIEHSDFILKLNEWILETSANQISKWREMGFKDLYLSLNLALTAFKSDDFLITTSKLIKKTSMDPRLLRFEVRESDILADREKHISFLKDLESLGVQILLDGFGTGFSSMTHLEKLPITSLKIDRSVIQKIDGKFESLGIFKAIIELAHGYKIKTIGEGVETRAQFESLKNCGCDIAQGFYLSKPVSSEHMNLILKTKSGERFNQFL